MCERCRTYALGRQVGHGSSLLSKLLLGFRACKHDPNCVCEDCKEYRQDNEYADFGWTGNRPTKETT